MVTLTVLAVSLVGPQDRAKVKAIEAAIGSPLEHQVTPSAGPEPSKSKLSN